MPDDKGGTALPWERRKNESAKAYEAFSCYMTMGTDRSIRSVAKELGKSETLIARWSSHHGWVERVREYDIELEREAYKKAVKGLSDMHMRHIKTAVLMQKKAVQALDSLPPEELSAKYVIQLINAGAKLERETRGSDPTVLAKQRQQAEQGASGLANAIIEAWKKRTEG